MSRDVVSGDLEGASCSGPQDPAGGGAPVFDSLDCGGEICWGDGLFLEWDGIGRPVMMNPDSGGMELEIDKKEYEKYVKKVTPVHSTLKNMVRAFITGGIICTIGQACIYFYGTFGMDKDTAASWTTLTLIAASVILTGLNIYPKIVKWGGAGALVPITGFATSVVAPAIEYKAEGHVFGIGCKIFTIAGPVILYGIFTSWVLGIIYWVGQLVGMV